MSLDWWPGQPVLCIADPAKIWETVKLANAGGYDLPKLGHKYIVAVAGACASGCVWLELQGIEARPDCGWRAQFCKIFFKPLEPEGMKVLKELETPIGDPDKKAPAAPKVPETVDVVGMDRRGLGRCGDARGCQSRDGMARQADHG